jgi:hypothetical protein
MEGSCERKPPHPALRRREMRQPLPVVNARGSVDVSMMRQQFGLLPGAKAATHKMLQAKMKKPRAFARRGHRGFRAEIRRFVPQPRPIHHERKSEVVESQNDDQRTK